jgi:predicted Zn-dependent peptidase
MKKIFLALSIIPCFTYAQVDRSVRPTAGPAPQINIKDSEVFTTENGITVILSENHKLPRVTFELVMGASPKPEGELAGLSEMAGSLIMSGTTNRSKDEIDAAIDYVGASLSADKNSIRLSCLTKHLEKGLDIMSDVLLNANFPQSEVDRIITQNESALLSAKSDAATMANNAVSRVNFPNHPYGEIMTEATLANINRGMLEGYYKQTFTPKGSYLVVVGDIDMPTLKKYIANYFASWKGQEAYKASLESKNTNSGARVFFVAKPGAVQSVIQVTFPLDITPGHEDYLKLNVLNQILGGGGFGSRLMQNLREDKAYTYGCYSRLNVTEDGSWLNAGGNFRNDVTDSAITQILYEFDRILKANVDQDELDLIKSSMAGSFSRSLESPSTVARFALGIIRNNLPKDYYQTYLKRLAAVTVDDMLATAKKYLTSSKLNIVVVGNEEVVDRLKPFDADGRIEKLDAFGNPVKERIAADITADELLNKYAEALFPDLSVKQRAKKMKKIKSLTEVFDLSMSQMPFPLTSTKVWLKSNVTGSKLEAQGMVLQKEYVSPIEGKSTNMQTGTETYTAEKLAIKNKSIGMIPEMNYKTSGMAYELIGIEELDGKDCYVLKLNDGETESFDYFEKGTFMKILTVSITKAGEETQESRISYSKFTNHNGILFPDEMNISMGQATLSGKLRSRAFNAKVDIDSFK